MERNEKHRQGVTARKDERTRIKCVKDLRKVNAFIPEELLTPIQDPEVEWKASDPTWKDSQMAKEKAKMKGMKLSTIEENEGEEALFIMDTTGDDRNRSFLHETDFIRQQEDFVPFDESEIDENSDNIIDSSDDDIGVM